MFKIKTSINRKYLMLKIEIKQKITNFKNLQYNQKEQ